MEQVRLLVSSTKDIPRRTFTMTTDVGVKGFTAQQEILQTKEIRQRQTAQQLGQLDTAYRPQLLFRFSLLSTPAVETSVELQETHAPFRPRYREEQAVQTRV